MSAPNATPAPKSLGEKLQSIERPYIFLILILVVSAFLFVRVNVPNEPLDATKDLYGQLMSLPEGSVVLVQSDWTLSTRGESGGQMEALLRILMHRKLKFAVYSAADPQAPQVARDVILSINREREAKGLKPAERWVDWVNLGFFPNAEATTNAMVTDMRGFLKDTQDVIPAEGRFGKVLESPVLANVKNFNDVGAYVVVTASATMNVAIERASGKGVPVLGMVTGVMGPETLPYYTSGQLNGLSSGLKGVFDLETMIRTGLNAPDANGVVAVKSDKFPNVIPGFANEVEEGKAARYYPTLHAALTLLILAVIIGNVGMFLARRGK